MSSIRIFFFQSILFDDILDGQTREKKEHGINQINIFELLTSFDDMIVKIQEESNMVQYNGIFIPLLYVELLIIIVNIDALCHMQVHLSRNYIPVVKSPPNIQAHLSRNISYSSATIIHVFHLSQWRYSYPTRSSMTKLLLSMSQH